MRVKLTVSFSRFDISLLKLPIPLQCRLFLASNPHPKIMPCWRHPCREGWSCPRAAQSFHADNLAGYVLLHHRVRCTEASLSIASGRFGSLILKHWIKGQCWYTLGLVLEPKYSTILVLADVPCPDPPIRLLILHLVPHPQPFSHLGQVSHPVSHKSAPIVQNHHLHYLYTNKSLKAKLLVWILIQQSGYGLSCSTQSPSWLSKSVKASQIGIKPVVLLSSAFTLKLNSDNLI